MSAPDIPLKTRIGMAVVVAALAAWSTAALAQQRFGLGRPLTEREIAGWDIDVKPDGSGLPPGRGDAGAGATLYAQQCAACHGARGEGNPALSLAGGTATLATPKPLKTVGSFWPYATTLFDYIRRTMPLPAPQSLKPDEVYALTAFILNLNGIVDAAAEMNASTLPRVEMPNRKGFKPVID